MSQGVSEHVLVYDDACGLCCAAATFLVRNAREPLRLAGFSRLHETGLLAEFSEAELRKSAHFLTRNGETYHGGASVTRALRLLRYGFIFAVFDLPGLSRLRDLVYGLVASNRQRLRFFAKACANGD